MKLVTWTLWFREKQGPIQKSFDNSYLWIDWIHFILYGFGEMFFFVIWYSIHFWASSFNHWLMIVHLSRESFFCMTTQHFQLTHCNGCAPLMLHSYSNIFSLFIISVKLNYLLPNGYKISGKLKLKWSKNMAFILNKWNIENVPSFFTIIIWLLWIIFNGRQFIFGNSSMYWLGGYSMEFSRWIKSSRMKKSSRARQT